MHANGYYQVHPVFDGTDAEVSTVPYLLPPDFEYDREQVIEIHGVASREPKAGVAISQDDFSLSWDKTVARVTVQADNMWKAGMGARRNLKNSFAAFCLALDQLEINDGSLRPGGAAMIIQRVVDALPLSLNEALPYRYGFHLEDRYVDLHPGMRLRIEFAVNQFVAPGSALNGFVGSGVHYWQVTRQVGLDGVQRLSFDAFLGALAASSISVATGGTGGLIDLQAARAARRHYRLCYPTQFAADSSGGNAGISENVTLIGADTLEDLNSATQAYTQSASTVTATQGQPPILYVFFRGRAAVVPEILIRLDNQSTYVPVGTTLRNLIDRDLNWSFPTHDPDDTPISCQRLWTVRGSTTYAHIHLESAPHTSFPTSPDVYDLPVIKGDAFSILSDIKVSAMVNFLGMKITLST